MKIENTDKEQMDTVVLFYHDEKSQGLFFFFFDNSKKKNPIKILTKKESVIIFASLGFQNITTAFTFIVIYKTTSKCLNPT